MTTYYILSALVISFLDTCATQVMTLMRKDRSKMAPVYLGIGWTAVQFTFVGGSLSLLSYSIWGVINIGWIAILWMVVVYLVKVLIHGFYDRLQHSSLTVGFHQISLAFCSISGFLIILILNIILWMTD